MANTIIWMNHVGFWCARDDESEFPFPRPARARTPGDESVFELEMCNKVSFSSGAFSRSTDFTLLAHSIGHREQEIIFVPACDIIMC
jgi:hypothetical protein